jgi:hypothetical protein
VQLSNESSRQKDCFQEVRDNPSLIIADLGDLVAAIKTLVQADPLIAGGDERLEASKLALLTTLFMALSQAKSQEIQAVVGKLSTSEVDVLMRYLYKAMASPSSFAPSVLLSWHEKVRCSLPLILSWLKSVEWEVLHDV